MGRNFTLGKVTSREIFFQIVLHVLLLLFFSLDKHATGIEEAKVVFFLHYSVWALVINYLLLPKYFYTKRYFWFLLYLALILAGIILIEELVLEVIYYPDTRAKGFPGVGFTLLQILPFIFIISGFKFAWDASQKQHEVDELKTAVKESELQFLKSQINPHFLFNNLNNLYSYAIESSPKTPSIILELSSVLRYMLYDCKEDFVPLSKEITHLKNFTKLNELQVEERGEVNFHADNIHNHYQIAPLILMVFIENAFKHSTASQSEGIKIDVTININENGELKFECKNTFQPNTNTDNLAKGIGLENVRKRLNLLYPDAHSLITKEENNLYFVELTMLLKREQK